MTDHHLLIEKLGRDLRPVKRPAATGKRLLVWLALALPAGIAASLLVPRTLTDWSQAGAIQAALQLMLAFMLGLLAMRSAFNLSIAGRRGISAKLLLPPGLLWLGLSASSLLQTAAPVQEHDTLPCFVFLLVVSVPMLLLTIASLRRTRALYPARSLALAGLGVACMALSLLAFCHPVHLHALDLLQHLAAIACIIVLTVLLGRRWVRID